MTYEQYIELLDSVGERPKLMNQDYEAPLVKLSRFSRENPKKYSEYRERMREETARRFNRLPWE